MYRNGYTFFKTRRTSPNPTSRGLALAAATGCLYPRYGRLFNSTTTSLCMILLAPWWVCIAGKITSISFSPLTNSRRTIISSAHHNSFIHKIFLYRFSKPFQLAFTWHFAANQAVTHGASQATHTASDLSWPKYVAITAAGGRRHTLSVLVIHAPIVVILRLCHLHCNYIPGKASSWMMGFSMISHVSLCREPHNAITVDSFHLFSQFLYKERPHVC